MDETPVRVGRAILALVIVVFEGISMGAPQNEVAILAEAMLAGEAQFNDLKLAYQIRDAVHYKNAEVGWRQTQGVYAHKLERKMWYVDMTMSRTGPSAEKGRLEKDLLCSFNGKGTLRLDRTKGDYGRATLMKGYRPDMIDHRFTPIGVIWQHDGVSLGHVIKQNIETFRVTDHSAKLGGDVAIRIEGTIYDGKATVTLWTSPKYNFLPLKMQVARADDRRMLSERVLLEMVQLPNGLWFPKRLRLGNPDPNYATVCEFSDISVDPIPGEFFSPQIPAGTRVYDEILGMVYTTQEIADLGQSALEQSDIKQDPAVVQETLDAYVRKSAAVDGEESKATAKIPPTEDNRRIVATRDGVSRSLFSRFCLGLWLLLLALIGSVLACVRKISRRRQQ